MKPQNPNLGLVVCRSLKPARHAAATLRRFRKERLSSQAEAISNVPHPSGEDNDSAAETSEVSGRRDSSNCISRGVKTPADTPEGHEHDVSQPKKGAEQGSRGKDHSRNFRQGDHEKLGESHDDEAGAGGLDRSHSTPGDIEGATTELQGSPPDRARPSESE